MKCFNKFQDRTVKSSDSVCSGTSFVRMMFNTWKQTCCSVELDFVSGSSQVRSQTMEKSNSQYDSFLFWRQPIPALDVSELADLGLTDGQPANSVKGKEKSSSPRSEEEEVRGRMGNGSVRTVHVVFLHQQRLRRTFRRHGYSVDKEITTQI